MSEGTPAQAVSACCTDFLKTQKWVSERAYLAKGLHEVLGLDLQHS